MNQRLKALVVRKCGIDFKQKADKTEDAVLPSIHTHLKDQTPNLQVVMGAFFTHTQN